ncbi:LysR family transcriptional regulator [Bacterioplanes sanyensis]|uniref:LysR family transcriptional regulator n=1 Tax=Bacterioplanes sanyensis TaxID=1249553 RepID=A0A222FMC1_9GAMM|nr:LysR family transcriptional regulator [Bacterioplanes sanyensis]ASP39920.1 LysR family transcriptional regulator [Bacterioplanes sanyensis]
MDTQSLLAFLAVVEHRSFSLAAEALHLSQSAISKRVQQLEQQLSCQLFDRHNRTISLTESGRVLLPKARQIVELMTDARLALDNLSDEVSGTLSMATSHHIGLHRLPPYLREFSQRYPQAQLQLQFLGSEGAYEAVQKRQVDLALTTLMESPPDNIEQSIRWRDSLVCVCAPNHPLAQINHPSLEQLAQYPAILPEANTITFDLIAAPFRERQLSLINSMPTNYLETIKMMVSVGLGWSVIPRSMVDAQLVELNWPGETLVRNLGIVRLRQRTLSNAAQALLQLLPPPS